MILERRSRIESGMVTPCLSFILSVGRVASGNGEAYRLLLNRHSLPSSGPVSISDLPNSLLPQILLTIPTGLCHRDLSILSKSHHMKNIVGADLLHSRDNIHLGMRDEAFLSVLKSTAEFWPLRGSVHSNDRTLSSFDPGDDMESLFIGQGSFAKFVLETPWA